MLLLPLAVIVNLQDIYVAPKVLGYYAAAAFFAFAIGYAFVAERKIRWNRNFYLAAAAFFVWNIAAAALAPDKVYAFIGNDRMIESIAFYLAGGIILTGFLQLQRSDWRRIGKVFIWQSLVISVIALLQVFPRWVTFDYAGDLLSRPISTLGNANYLAGYLVAVLPIVFWYFFAEKRFWLRAIYAVVIAADIWALVMAASRMAWIALAILLVAGIVQALRKRNPQGKRNYRAAAGYLAVAVLFAGLYIGFAKLARPLDNESTITVADPNVSSRLRAWKLGLEAAVQHPVFGLGPNNFTLYYELHRPLADAQIAGYFDQAHDLALEMLVNAGWLGLACFLVLAVMLLWRAIRALWKDPSGFSSAVALALLMIGLCTLTGPMDHISWLLAFAFAAFLLAPQPADSEEPQFLAANRWLSYGAMPLLEALSVVMLLGAGSYFVSQWYLSHGSGALTYDNNPQLAARDFRIASHANPFDIVAINSYGVALFQLKQPAPAELAWITRFHPHLALAYFRQYSIALQFAEAAQDRAAYQVALDGFNTSVQLDQNNPDLRLHYAFALYEVSDFADAKSYARQALQMNPNSQDGWMLLAIIADQQQDWQERYNDILAAFKVNPIPYLKHFLEAQKASPVPIPISTSITDG